MIKIAEPNARREYEALLNAVIAEADGTGERVALMDRFMEDAIQAHRHWAVQVEGAARRNGYAAEIKTYLKRTRVVINLNDREISKPRTIGTRRESDDGKVIDLQLPFEVLTFDQIRDKRREYLTQINAYTDNLAVADRLLALAEMAPGSNTPAEAAKLLGIVLDEYLGMAS